jgi:uncharacterized protein
MINSLEKVTFFLTNECNLSCRYCVIKKEKQTLSFKYAKKILNVLLNNNKKEISLIFSGGEPLLKIDLIKKIIFYIEKKGKNNGKNINYRIITNGTIINSKIISFIKKHNIEVVFSIDGTKKEHDKNRIFKDGKGSYNLVVNNFKKIKEVHSEINISSVIYISNKKITEDLDSLISLEPRYLYLNLDLNDYKKKYDKKTYNYFINQICNWYIDFFRKNRRLPQITIINRLLARIYDFKKYGKIWEKHFCQFTAGKYLVLNEKNGIYPCFLFKEKGMFSLNSSQGIDENKYRLFRGLLTEYFKESKKCDKCRAKNVCDKTICPGLDLYLSNGFNDSKVACAHYLLFFDIANKIFKSNKNDKNFLSIIRKENREKRE